MTFNCLFLTLVWCIYLPCIDAVDWTPKPKPY